MEETNVEKAFRTLGLSCLSSKKYSGPDDYAMSFEKCSILVNVEASTTNSTQIADNRQQ